MAKAPKHVAANNLIIYKVHNCASVVAERVCELRLYFIPTAAFLVFTPLTAI